MSNSSDQEPQTGGSEKEQITDAPPQNEISHARKKHPQGFRRTLSILLFTPVSLLLLSFALLADTRAQSSDQLAALSAERASNTARIAAIDQEAGPTANELRQALQE